MKPATSSPISLIFLHFFIILFTTGCVNETELFNTKADNLAYIKNNELATSRLTQIMFNQTDTENVIERFKIVHITDAHLSPWSSDNNYKYPKNLLEAVKFANQGNLMINMLVSTGDCIHNDNKTSHEDALRYLTSFADNIYNNNFIPTFAITGNHDSNMLTDDSKNIITKNDFFNTVTSEQNYSCENKGIQNYYYTDLPNPMGGVIRLIALDVIDQVSSTFDTQHYAVFSQEQIDWLCNEALKNNLSEDHSVIVLVHHPFKPYIDSTNNYSINNEYMYSREMIPEIIEAYRSKKKLQKEYKSSLNKGNIITVNTDFSSSSGEFVCYLSGHLHTTAILEVDGITNRNVNLPRQRMILSSNMSPSDNSTTYSLITRNANDITNNSFNIYAIDTKEKKVYITFFGAYKPSNKPDYSEIQVFNYL